MMFVTRQMVRRIRFARCSKRSIFETSGNEKQYAQLNFEGISSHKLKMYEYFFFALRYTQTRNYFIEYEISDLTELHIALINHGHFVTIYGLEKRNEHASRYHIKIAAQYKTQTFR